MRATRLLATWLLAASASLAIVAGEARAAQSAAADIDAAMILLEDRVAQLDRESAPAARVRLFQDALEARRVIDGFAAAGAARETVRLVQARVRDAALSADALGIALVEALSTQVDSSEAGMAIDLRAKAAALALSDPAYRAAAWTALALRHLALGAAEEAERLASRAVEDASRIAEPALRDGALRALVLPGLPGPERAVVAAAATDAMVSAGSRSQTYRELARSILATRGPVPDDEALGRQASADMPAREALLHVQAMSRDHADRQPLLKRHMEHAIESGDEALALEIAKSMPKAKDADDALADLVERHIAKGKPLRAVPWLPLILSDTERGKATVAIARSLRDDGYEAAAADLLAGQVEATDDHGRARIAAEMAAMGDFVHAEAVAARITDRAAGSFARSRIAKRLGEEGQLDAAKRLIAELHDEADLSHARGGLGLGQARSGDVAAAEATLDLLTNEEDRARVLEAIARAHAKGGRTREAVAQAERLGGTGPRGDLLLAIASELPSAEGATARSLTRRALDLAGQITDARARDALLKDGAILSDALGDEASAERALQAIHTPGMRETAEAEIARARMARGDDVRSGRIPSPADPMDRSEMAAAIAEATYDDDGDIRMLLRRLDGVHYSDRVQALRRVATRAAQALDEAGWLSGQPPSRAARPESVTRAELTLAGQVLTAPVSILDMRHEMTAPDIFTLTASSMRAEMPAPRDGSASLSVLGFSPFSLEAFKLTRSGEATIHRVQMAQNLTWPFYIAIEDGVVTLGQLLRKLPRAVQMGFLAVEGDTITIRAPIIVMPHATLLLSGAEFGSYRISATTGAFMAVAGRLVMQDAELVGWDETSGEPAVASEATKADFRPFITAWGGSVLDIAGSRLAMLGYDYGKAYGLTQSSGASVQTFYGDASPPTGRLVDNSFDNLRYGYYSYEAADVAIIGNEYRDNVVYGIDPHDRSHGLVIALNTSYGADKKHGIIFSREVDDSFILGNLSVLNRGSGLMLDRTSEGNVVYANTALANGGDGLTFYESGCNVAVFNNLSDNVRAGIKVRNSAGVLLSDNRISGNRDAGVDLYIADLEHTAEGQSRDVVLDPYEQVTTVALGENTFEGNGSAINADRISRIILDRNRFINQGTRIFGGDLRPLSSYLLQIGDDGPLQVEPMEAFSVGPSLRAGLLNQTRFSADTSHEPSIFGEACRIIERASPQQDAQVTQ